MARVTLSDPGGFERKLKEIINNKQKQVIKDLEKYLVKVNEMLGDKFAESKEFKDIKGSLRGEFGFTDSEVTDIDRVINIIKTDKKITKIRANRDTVVLEWIDFDALKNHEVAQHDLTKLNSKTDAFEVVQTVSWVDWLENGLSITGYAFEDGGGKFSRSKEGRMVEGTGLFKLPRTKIFDKIARSISKKEVSAGIATILQRKMK